MIRPHYQNEDYFNVFFNNEVVAVGWSDYDFSKYKNIEHLFPEIDYLKDVAPTTAGKWMNQIRRFKNMNEGDRVIVPTYNSVCFAIVKPEEVYDKTARGLDQCNQRRVSYIMNGDKLAMVSRNELSEKLQRRLRVRGSIISDLNEFSDELNELFLHVMASEEEYTYKTRLNHRYNTLIKEFKTQLKNNIQNGETYLQTGGIGLEHLVNELLIIDGYDSSVLAKNKFPSFADADIQAIRRDRFIETNLLFQVKHHHGITDDWGIKQLTKIREFPIYEATYDHLILVTSGSFDEKTIAKAKQFEVELINGDDLVDWIYDNLVQLSERTKLALGIKDVPTII
jgi:restriction system protein